MLSFAEMSQPEELRKEYWCFRTPQPSTPLKFSIDFPRTMGFFNMYFLSQYCYLGGIMGVSIYLKFPGGTWICLSDIFFTFYHGHHHPVTPLGAEKNRFPKDVAVHVSVVGICHP